MFRSQDEMTEAQAIIETMIDGLPAAIPMFDKKSSRALFTMAGPEFVELVAAANEYRTRSGHRQWLTDLIDRDDDLEEIDGQIGGLP